jgi:hypothetical protein
MSPDAQYLLIGLLVGTVIGLVVTLTYGLIMIWREKRRRW